jgi:hypothetical protein
VSDATLPANEGVKQLDAELATSDSGLVYQQRVQVIGGFKIPPYDYVAFGYTGADVTSVTYKTGAPREPF